MLSQGDRRYVSDRRPAPVPQGYQQKLEYHWTAQMLELLVHRRRANLRPAACLIILRVEGRATYRVNWTDGHFGALVRASTISHFRVRVGPRPRLAKFSPTPSYRGQRPSGIQPGWLGYAGMLSVDFPSRHEVTMTAVSTGLAGGVERSSPRSLTTVANKYFAGAQLLGER